MRVLRRSCLALSLACLVSVCAVAHADIIPEPSRPGWKDHAPPEPDAPDELAWTLGALAVVAAGAAAGAWWKRSHRGVALEHA